MKINIENPCHENWNDMLPDEKGAFCLACQKTVIDFSQKSTQEIKDFFISVSSQEKICGRFRNNQFLSLNFDHFFERFKNWALPKKLVVVMCFTFGLSLFSCKTTQEPIMGDVAIEPFSSSNELLLGKVAPQIDTLSEPVNSDSSIEVPHYKMGEVIALPLNLMIKSETQSLNSDTLHETEFNRKENKE